MGGCDLGHRAICRGARRLVRVMTDQGGGKRRCGGMAMIAPFVRLKPSAWPGSPSAATHAWSRGFSGPSKIFSNGLLNSSASTRAFRVRL
jgi:hypothetical protein